MTKRERIYHQFSKIKFHLPTEESYNGRPKNLFICDEVSQWLDPKTSILYRNLFGKSYGKSKKYIPLPTHSTEKMLEILNRPSILENLFKK